MHLKIYFDIEQFHTTFMLDHKTFTKVILSAGYWASAFFLSSFFFISSCLCLILEENKRV